MVFDHDPKLQVQTTNLSRTGLCVSSDYLAETGAELSGAIMLPGLPAPFRARVIWARKVRAGQSLNEKNTMGLEFTVAPGGVYDQYIDDAGGGRPTGAHPSVAPQPSSPPTQPAHEAVPTLAPVRRAPPPAQWLSSPKGLIGQIKHTIEARDLAAPAGTYSSGLASATVASWVEQAAMRCVAGILPPNAVTVGVNLHITVGHEPAALVGDKIATTVRVSEVSADGNLLTFELRVDDGRRALVAGRHTRLLLHHRKL